MTVPGSISSTLRSSLGELHKFDPASGGCINHCGIIHMDKGKYFLKWNNASAFLNMLQLEKKGLGILLESKTIRVPKTFEAGQAADFQYLVMEVISSSPRQPQYWRVFGEQLARLHQCSSTAFGLDEDNYIGSLPQKNTCANSWIDFFIDNRLNFQLQVASKSGLISSSTVKQFEQLYPKLSSLLPNEKPALLHGDLWGGNIMVDESGLPCVIDPAVYYGHREVDIAMTMLFGGFDMSYLKSYNEVYPLSPGFKERLPIYNLYPLLVHVNLFGSGYVSQVKSVLAQFI
jgi:protein-ribulosamine 3-kinase